ncbi:MAG: CvpA family protein [Candidatus Omnitrophica bacterium]|nr:CvpA family protein [Candidatus Omnitrophota bacterium]
MQNLQEWIARLTWADYIALIAVLRGLYVGFRSGFFPELLRIVSYLITAIVTFHYHASLAQLLTLKTFLNEATAQAVAFGGLLIGVFLLTKGVTMLILKLLKVSEGGFLSRLVGGVVGACRWIVLLSLIFMLVGYMPLPSLNADIQNRSLTGRHVASAAPLIFDFLSKLSPQLGVK